MKFDRVYIEISNICNLQCDFCPEVLRPKKIMGPALFKKIVSQVKPLVREVTFHVMGEPLNHPQFREFVEHCGEQGVAVNVTTNGTLLGQPGIIESLLLPSVRQVNFSFQSLTAQKSQTESDLLALRDRYLKRIFDFTQRAFVERPELYINFRLWNVGTSAADIENNNFFLEPIAREFNFELSSPVDVAFRKSRHILNRLYLHFDSRFDWPTLNGPVRQTEGFCHALKNHFAILADGAVVPCCLDKESLIELGRIDEESASGALIEILNSPRARNLRNAFDRGEVCENLCQRCQYIERFAGKAGRIKSY